MDPEACVQSFLENMQRVGSGKPRGQVNAVRREMHKKRWKGMGYLGAMRHLVPIGCRLMVSIEAKPHW